MEEVRGEEDECHVEPEEGGGVREVRDGGAREGVGNRFGAKEGVDWKQGQEGWETHDEEAPADAVLQTG